MPRKTLPEFEWPKCHQCQEEIGCSKTMGGKYRAGCGNCNDRGGYALADNARLALIKYLNKETFD